MNATVKEGLLPFFGETQEGRFGSLGIPRNELTRNVSLAVSALLEKIDDLTRELDQTRDHLKEMEELVDVDCLVPIPNRRAFMRRLEWAISMLNRYGHGVSVLFFDVNELKEINDTLGHAAGDAAIAHVARVLSGTVRDSDFVGRLGGDEFGVIMYHASQDNAEKRADHIRKRLIESRMLWNGKSLAITVAVGAHAIKPGEMAEEALAEADRLMYVDKGRMKRTRGTNLSA